MTAAPMPENVRNSIRAMHTLRTKVGREYAAAILTLIHYAQAEPARVAAAVGQARAEERARCESIARDRAEEYADIRGPEYRPYAEGAEEVAEEIADAISGTDAVTTRAAAPARVCGRVAERVSLVGTVQGFHCMRTAPCAEPGCTLRAAAPTPAPEPAYREPDPVARRALLNALSHIIHEEDDDRIVAAIRAYGAARARAAAVPAVVVNMVRAKAAREREHADALPPSMRAPHVALADAIDAWLATAAARGGREGEA